jgi:uncharacterized iron-regulated membrane protein
MSIKQIRSLAFHLHRWLGLGAGILLCIAGITGSVLVFWHEIDQASIADRFGQIRPTDTKAAIDSIIATVKTTYAPQGLTLSDLDFPTAANQPYIASLVDAAEHYR